MLDLTAWDIAWFKRQDKKCKEINPSARLHWHSGYPFMIKRGLYIYWIDYETGDQLALWVGFIDAQTAVNIALWLDHQMHERGLYGKKSQLG